MEVKFLGIACEEADIISQWYCKYVNYFQESTFLLKQKFWAELVKKFGPLSLEQLQRAVNLQYAAWTTGREVHLGEILLENGIMDDRQICRVFQELGTVILCCPLCHLYFQKKIFLPDKEQYCPECNTLLTPDSPAESLVRDALRADYFSPRLLSPKDRDCSDEHEFLFLEAAEYRNNDVSQLEGEISSIVESFRYWLNMASKGPKIMQPQPGPESAHHNSIAISRRITKRITKRFKIQDLEAETAHVPRKFDASLIPLFWGYMHNLHELFWIARQKMFARICLTSRSLSPAQLDKGIDVQYSALCSGKLLHLGDVMLRLHLLDEEQVMAVLSGMGERIWTCPGCHLSLLQVVSQDICPICPRCRRNLYQDTHCALLYKTLSADFFPPIPLIPASRHNQFIFYKPRQGYCPDFSLQAEDLSAAYRSLQLPPVEAATRASEITERPRRAVQEAPRESEKMGSTWEDITDYIGKLDKNSADESIYDQYIATGDTNPKQELLKVVSQPAAPVPTGVEASPAPTPPPRRIWGPLMISLVFAIAIFSALLVGGRCVENFPFSQTAGERGNRKLTDNKKDGARPTPGTRRPDKADPPNAEVKETADRSADSTTGRIEGKIYLQGQKLKGLKVFVASLSDPDRRTPIACGEDGSFSLNVDPGEYRLHLGSDNYPWLCQEKIRISAGEIVDVSMQVPLFSSVKMIVAIPANHRILVSPILDLLHVESRQLLQVPVEIAASGEYNVDCIGYGLYEAVLRIPGLPDLPPQKVHLMPGQQTLLEFRWHLATIEGYVEPLDLAAKPKILLHELALVNGVPKPAEKPIRETYPNDNGYFALPEVKAGSYLIMAKSKSRFACLRTDVAPGDNKLVRLMLEECQTLEVKVNCQGKPAAGARVIAVSSPLGEVRLFATADGEGHAELTGLPPGTYIVTAYSSPSPDISLTFSTAVTIASSPLVLKIDIE